MPEDSRPALTVADIESVAAGWAAADAAPLVIPPGCSASVEAIVRATKPCIAAPSAGPPSGGGTSATLQAGDAAPTLAPTRRDDVS